MNRGMVHHGSAYGQYSPNVSFRNAVGMMGPRGCLCGYLTLSDEMLLILLAREGGPFICEVLLGYDTMLGTCPLERYFGFQGLLRVEPYL